jgi:hypothetical protein
MSVPLCVPSPLLLQDPNPDHGGPCAPLLAPDDHLPLPSVPASCLINLAPADLACRPTRIYALGDSSSRALDEMYPTDSRNVQCSPRGQSDSPSNGLGFTRSNVTKCSTLVSFLLVSLCAGKQALALVRQIPGSVPPARRPTLFHCSILFLCELLPVVPLPTPSAATCRGLIQISKTTTTTNFLLGGAS